MSAALVGQVHIILGVVDTGTLFGEVGFVTIFIRNIYKYRKKRERED